MRLADWLYGPPRSRAYRLDLDTVRELGEAITDSDPELIVRYSVTDPLLGINREVDANALDGLSAADLSRLMIDARRPDVEGQIYRGPVANVGLGRRSSWVSVVTADGSNMGDDPLTRRLGQILADSSRPLLRRREVPVGAAVLWVPLLALLTGWLWLEATTPLAIPVHVIGWAVVFIALIVTMPAYRDAKVRWSTYSRQPLNGHIVLSETRRETAASRANSRRDLKVVVITALSTLAVTIIAAMFLSALGIYPLP